MAPPSQIPTPGCRPILEELIGLACPERAREYSDRLIERFGSFAVALNAAPTDRIAALGGQDAEPVFTFLRTAIDIVLKGRISQGAILSSEPSVINYLRAAMGFAPVEQFRVLFLNAANELMADEVMSVGTVSSVHVYPREVMKRCLELGATAIILAHNHPSGRLTPSRADQQMTRKIVLAARSLDVIVHDHIVVTRQGSLSFRRRGFL